MDALATKFLENPPKHLAPNKSPTLFPAQQVCVTQDNDVLTADIPNKLVYGEKKVITRHYFQKHLNSMWIGRKKDKNCNEKEKME